jgi:hypothetical protein
MPGRARRYPVICNGFEAGYSDPRRNSRHGDRPPQHGDRAHSRAAEVKSFNANISNEIAGGSPEEFTAFMRAELEKWGKVIKVTGVRGD